MYIQIVGYCYICFPIVTLIVWGALMFNLASDDACSDESRDLDIKNETFLGGISIYLIGAAALFCVLVMNKISWNNYRFKKQHMVVLGFSYICFTCW